MIGIGEDIGVTACAPSTDESADGDQETDFDDNDDDDEYYDPGEVVMAIVIFVAGVPAAGKLGHAFVRGGALR